MKFPRVRRLWPWKKRRLSLRLRLALWSGGLVLLLSFGLLLFINTVAITTFPRIIRSSIGQPAIQRVQPTRPVPPGVPLDRKIMNPLELALLLELQNISLIGLALVSVLGGVGAYWLAGRALRPVRRVSQAAQNISAQTLHTRLALDGPKDEVKELADTFDAMLGRLEHTFELQNSFMADVAHELRTPLASLRTNLEVVAVDPSATLDDYKFMADTQERALTRLERLIADFFILTTSEQPLSKTEVTLGALLEETLYDLQAVANERQITLEVINQADVVTLGHGPLLARAFSNLIENGMYYNHEGGRVTVTIDSKNPWAVVTIADTGIGIAPEKQTQIFDRFYRVDSSRARHKGGSGLGLSIVSAIVQRHGGKIQLESSPSAGSTFTVLLPLSS
jgi:signal transduction histidine kinase